MISFFFQAVNRAFHFAKNKSQGDSKHGDDLLEFREFRLFLQTMRQFFEYYQAFARYVCTNYIAYFVIGFYILARIVRIL